MDFIKDLLTILIGLAICLAAWWIGKKCGG